MPANESSITLPSIQIKAITWNMGNKKASRSVVNELARQLKDLPTVIALSTQEELAGESARLQDKLLEKLNADLAEGERYRLVQTTQPQFHITTAGANNSPRTLALSLLTEQNRVSSAVLVKEPYLLENPIARIDYEPGKKTGNKSIITIKGELKLKNSDQPPLSLAISGGHLDSNSDKKRRAHANKFLRQEDLKNHREKTFTEIYEEASVFRILMGDMNERDYLMADGTIQDRTQLTNYKAYGFDIDRIPNITRQNGQSLHGTYGFIFDENNQEQIKNTPDPRKRRHVAKGGFLDRICFTSGLTTKSAYYGYKMNDAHFKKPNHKWFYHDSDHLPLIREFKVTLPKSKQQAKIVGEYLKKRLPDFSTELNELNMLKAHYLGHKDILKAVKSLQFHDSTLSAEDYLQHMLGIDPKSDFHTIEHKLNAKINHQTKLINDIATLKDNINLAIATNNKEYLVRLFNLLTQCNELRNKSLEIMSLKNETLPEKEKTSFFSHSNNLIHSLYQFACGKIGKLTQIEKDSNTLDKILKDHPIFKGFKKLKAIIQQKITDNHLWKKFKQLYTKPSHKEAADLQQKGKSGTELLQKFKHFSKNATDKFISPKKTFVKFTKKPK